MVLEQAARDPPIAQIAAELGYSPRTFRAMMQGSVEKRGGRLLSKAMPASQGAEPSVYFP
jgi:hypothetical protein